MSSRAGFLATPSQPRSRSLAFAGTFVLLALLTACVTLIPHMAFVAVSACYLGVFLTYLGLRSDSQGGNLFEVIIPFSVLGFLYFGVGTMYIVIVPEALDFPALAQFLLPAHALSPSVFLASSWVTVGSSGGRRLPRSDGSLRRTFWSTSYRPLWARWG